MILFIAILVGALIGQTFLPWWVIVPVALAASFWKGKSPLSSFLIAFFAIFMLWSLSASYLSIQNDHLLANRIGQMFGLPLNAVTWIWMAIVSALPGAVTAGFAGLSGYFLRRITTASE